MVLRKIFLSSFVLGKVVKEMVKAGAIMYPDLQKMKFATEL